MLEDYADLTVEHIAVEAGRSRTTLVDITLTARACEEHCPKQRGLFLTASSDSDYWGLITSMPHAKFLVMVEREKCGIDMKKALADSEIFYCFHRRFLLRQRRGDPAAARLFKAHEPDPEQGHPPERQRDVRQRPPRQPASP
ncbi:MAG: hypothetical protein ACLUNZ_08185 [Evtepia sp.]